jgi:hypothetical protein
MQEPSFKGTIFGPVAEELKALRERGRIGEDELATALEAKDLLLLEAKTTVATWYPIETYARYLDLLCRLEGGGDPHYFEKRGSISARRLMDAGLYSQLDLLGSIADEPTRVGNDAEQRALRAYRSKLAVVLSLAGSIYNVGRWKVIEDEQHPGRAAIEIREADAYSDGMAGAIVGFLDECARAVSHKIQKLYRFERPTRDRIVIRMLRDLYEVRSERTGRPG